MKDETLRGRARETAKLAIRHALTRLDLDIARDPYVRRVVRTMTSRGIDQVVDVGANVGQFATQLRHAGFAGRIVSVEPLSGAYAELARRASRDRDWACVHAAVGVAAGTQTINVAANSYSSSLLAVTGAHLDAAPDSESVATESVTMIGLQELVATRGLEPSRALLKIDTQGYEGQVLDSAGPLLDEFAAVQLELSYVELYEGQPLHDELIRRMETHGFGLWSMETGISGPDGRLLQYDGLFVRR